MDRNLRGLIENAFDAGLKESFREDVEWIQRQILISSARDVAIGYIAGGLMSAGIGICMTSKRHYPEKEQYADIEEIKQMLKRRLPEIVESVERELNR